MGVLELVVLMMNYVGVFAFAVSGALKRIDKNMDIFGCAFLGLATAFGGNYKRHNRRGPADVVVYGHTSTFIPHWVRECQGAGATLPRFRGRVERLSHSVHRSLSFYLHHLGTPTPRHSHIPVTNKMEKFINFSIL